MSYATPPNYNNPSHRKGSRKSSVHAQSEPDRERLPDEMKTQIGVDDWTWVDHLFNPPHQTLRRAIEGVCADVDRLEERRDELVRNKKPSDFILRVINTIKEKDLIGFLANHNVLPKYGFPVDVVELELLHHGEEAKRLELERDLRLAIAEYAPGCEVVAGGFLWQSRGLKTRPRFDWPKFDYVICSHCGRYRSKRHEVSDPILQVCQGCGATQDRLSKKGTFVVPEFGFVTGEKPRRPTEARPERTYASRVYFAAEGNAEGNQETLERNGVRLTTQFSRSGKLAVVNSSLFAICSQCGYGHAARAVSAREQSGAGHAPPWSLDSARTCNGMLNYWNLGHEFQTDLFELRVQGLNRPQKFWLSLLYALLEGAAAALSIRRQDLDGCLYSAEGAYSLPALVLFDDVPGGAGHVRRIGECLDEVLRAARDHLDGRCGCGGGKGGAGETSCYGCLRNYRNQWLHDQLARGPVFQFLDNLLR